MTSWEVPGTRVAARVLLFACVWCKCVRWPGVVVSYGRVPVLLLPAARGVLFAHACAPFLPVACARSCCYPRLPRCPRRSVLCVRVVQWWSVWH